MMRPEAPGGASAERRRWSRVRLALPVKFSRSNAATGGAVAAYAGESIDVGTGGVCVTTGAGEMFVPGEMLTVSIAVPWEARREFPFSRIVGPSRVVRSQPDAAGQRLALAFNSDQMTMLGAIVTIR